MSDKILTNASAACFELAVQATRAYPDIPITPQDFADYLAALVGQGELPSQSDAESLLLARGCILGHDEAIRRFHILYVPVIDAALGRLRLGEATATDLRQATLEKLIVGRDDSPPKIADYRGRGPLGAWLRVTATRVGLKAIRKRNPEVGDERLADQASAGDPELVYIKSVYRDAFRASFSEALGSLSARDRNLLRQSIVDHLTIDDLGSLYGVHRATASRWVAAAKELLTARTRAAFIQRAKIPEQECDSVLRLVQSRLEVTFRTVASANHEPEKASSGSEK